MRATRVGLRPLLPLLLGGVLYTSGAVIEIVGQPVIVAGLLGPHELLHLAVLGGLAMHAWHLHRVAPHPLRPRSAAPTARAQIRPLGSVRS